jgi:hypothetical protein
MPKELNVIIYESSSFGGCYNYSIQLLNAYQRNSCCNDVTLILPACASTSYTNVLKILCDDQKSFSTKFQTKSYFLYRQLLNPFRLFFYLLNRPQSFVLFNDFEQLTCFLWVPFFKFFLTKHVFGIFLHDPDRDNYPPTKWFSVFSMKILCKWANLLLFHDSLPDKIYYKGLNHKYLAVPHGLYPKVNADPDFSTHLQQVFADYQVISILGNIRAEKNYEFAIRLLVDNPNCALIVAGKPSSSEVNIQIYKDLAQSLEVADRVLWFDDYLSDEKLASVIEISDWIWLYYANSFASQSAIFNTIAHYRKRLIVSKTASSLTYTVESFNLSKTILPDNQLALNQWFISEINASFSPDVWDEYLNFACWDTHVAMVVNRLGLCY